MPSHSVLLFLSSSDDLFRTQVTALSIFTLLLVAHCDSAVKKVLNEHRANAPVVLARIALATGQRITLATRNCSPSQEKYSLYEAGKGESSKPPYADKPGAVPEAANFVRSNGPASKTACRLRRGHIGTSILGHPYWDINDATAHKDAAMVVVKWSSTQNHLELMDGCAASSRLPDLTPRSHCLHEVSPLTPSVLPVATISSSKLRVSKMR